MATPKWMTSQTVDQPKWASSPASEDDNWQTTEYGFKVKPTQVNFGAGPTQTLQREDGAVWADPSKGWKPVQLGLASDKPGWKVPYQDQWVDAPSRPQAQRGALSRALGAETWGNLGRNMLLGATKASDALEGLGADVAYAVGAKGTEEYIEGQKEREARARYKAGTAEAQGGALTSGQMTGEAVPQILSMLAMKRMLPTVPAGAGFMSRASAEALPAMATTYLMTPGTQQERLAAANMAGPMAVAGEGLATVVKGGASRIANRLAGRKGATPQVAAEAVEAVGGPAAAPGGAVLTAPVDEFDRVGTLARDAGLGKSSAKFELAELAQINTQAREAAERLGLELPVDVLSDNPQIRAAAGLTRSVAASEPEAMWVNTVRNAVAKADENIQGFAAFSEGRVSPGMTSEKVRGNLLGTAKELDKQAEELYKVVNDQVPWNAPTSSSNLERELARSVETFGEAGLSKVEKRLLAMVKQNPTYGAAIREKNILGQALKKNPFDDMDQATIKRLYGAMAEDQLETVGILGGEELRQQLRSANLLTAKKKGLEKRIVSAFGDDLDGSIVRTMQNAIQSAGKGSSAEFNKLLKVVPEELKRETIGTAIASLTRSEAGAMAGTFDYNKLQKLWPNIKANPEVFKEVYKAMGPESVQVLDDLALIGKRITDARAQVLTTGKANQALVNSMTAERLLDKVMSAAKGTAARTVAAVAGGPIAVAASDAMDNVLTKAQKKPLEAAGKLLASADFRDLAISAAKGKPKEIDIAKVAMSKPFGAFAKIAGIADSFEGRAGWLTAAMSSAGNREQPSQRIVPPQSQEDDNVDDLWKQLLSEGN